MLGGAISDNSADLFSFEDATPAETYTLSLHDALPIFHPVHGWLPPDRFIPAAEESGDRKSTRLNSSHANISYAVFCLKKKNKAVIAIAACVDVDDTEGIVATVARVGNNT